MVEEHGADNFSVRILNKIDKLVAGEQAYAERVDLGRTRVFEGFAGEAAPHSRLVVEAGDKLLLLGAFGALRTLEFYAQILFEPVNRLGNAVDERLDEFGVGNAATDGLDGVDKVLFVVFVDGTNKPEAPGAREEARSAHAMATVAPARAASMAAQRPAMPDPITSTSVDSIGFLSRSRIVARVIGKGIVKT